MKKPTITETQKETILKLYQEKQSHQAIADEMKIPIGTVKTVIYRNKTNETNETETNETNETETNETNETEQRLDALENQVQAINNGLQEIKSLLSALMQNNVSAQATPTQDENEETNIKSVETNENESLKKQQPKTPITEDEKNIYDFGKVEVKSEEDEKAEEEAIAEFMKDNADEDNADEQEETHCNGIDGEAAPQEETQPQEEESSSHIPATQEKTPHIPMDKQLSQRKKEKLDKLLSEYGLIEPQARYLKDKAEWDEEIKREVAKKQETIKPPTVAEEKEMWKEFFTKIDINTGKPFKEDKNEKGTMYYLNPDVYEQRQKTRGLGENTLEYASWLVDNVDGKQALCKGLQGIIRIQPKYNIYCKNLPVDDKTKQRVTIIYEQMRKQYKDLMDYLEYDAPYYTTHFYYTPKDSEDDFFFGYVDYGNALDAYNIPDDVKAKIKDFVQEYANARNAKIRAIQAAKEAQEEAEAQARKQQREAEAQAVREEIDNPISAA